MGFATFELPGDDMSMSGGETQLVCQRLAERTSAIGGDAGAEAYQAALKIENGVHDGAPIDFSDAEARQFIEIVDALRGERRLIRGAMRVRNALNDRLAAGWQSDVRT